MANDNSQYSPDTFKVLLKKLVQTPAEFKPEDCAECFRHLVTHTASEAQVRLHQALAGRRLLCKSERNLDLADSWQLIV